MAKISLILACSHSPFLYIPPEAWDEIRATRPVRNDVPRDSLEINQAKFDRCMKAFSTLRQKIAAARPDVLIIFGDDQLEQFNLTNLPALGVFLCSEFEGRKRSIAHHRNVRVAKIPEERARLKGNPGFGRQLLEELMRCGFDLTFSMELPNPDRGLGHAFMHPAFYLTPEYDIPILPFFVNCYYPPQPSGRRCYELGRAVRQAVERSTMDLNVAILGSGGLWHTPGVSDAYIDQEFDQTVLEHIQSGEAWNLAQYFDGFPWPYPPASSAGVAREADRRGAIGSGTGETRNWIVVASVAEGVRGALVDYVPVYASPCGMAFAYWEEANA